MGLGLFSRIAVSLSVVLCVAMSALGYVLLQDLSARFSQQQLDQARVSAKALVDVSRDALLREDYSQLENRVASIVSENNLFAYAILSREDGSLIAHSDTSISSQVVVAVGKLETVMLRSGQYQGRPVQELIYPVSADAKYLANAHLAYFRDVDVFSQGDVAQRIIFVLVGTWLFAVAVLLITLRRTMKPLSLLTELITTTTFDSPRREINEDLRAEKDEVGVLACAFDAMVANLQKSYEELGEREAHYRQLVETANVIPWELDLNTRRITYVGPQATGILGYPQDDWYKENFWLEHVYQEDRNLAENFYRQVAAGKNENEIEYRMLHASGSVVWVRDWVHYSLRNSRMPILQGFMFDVSEQVSTREELRQYREHLENLVAERTAELVAANQELQTFAHSISQDLRVPLRIINGFSQAVLEDYGEMLDEEGKDNLRRICAGTQRMGKMIDDLLILSRVTRQELRRQKFDMSEFVQRINTRLQQDYPGRDVNCVVQPGVKGYGDPHLLRIVLENLLSNAWKYTAKADAPQIEFSMHEVDGKAIYTVSDNGAGFDMQYADKLFSPFKRLHNTEEFEGMGVGLAIVQRIVLRHGGEVWGEGAVDKGAAFSFTLSGGSIPSSVSEKNVDKGYASRAITIQ